MKRILLSLIILSSVFLVPILSFSSAKAAFDPFPVCDGNTTDASVCHTDGEDPLTGSTGIILRAVKILSYAVGFAAVVMIIIGGFKFITANGNSESITSARNTVIFALVGVAVFAVSQLIVRYIISRL